MFPDLEMFNKMHENGDKQYAWGKRVATEACLPRCLEVAGVEDSPTAGARDPASPALVSCVAAIGPVRPCASGCPL